MRNNLTEIVCVVDRSGSMGNLTDDVIGGINQFIRDQRELDGDANFTLILFDNDIDIVHNGVDINKVPLLDRNSYRVRGSTAMNDGIAVGINIIGAKLHGMNEEDRPGKVLFAIMTDGHENASREFTTENIKDMIDHQTEKYAWEFIFMAANIDVDRAADAIGVRSANRYAFGANSDGVTMAYSTLSNATSQYRLSK